MDKSPFLDSQHQILCNLNASFFKIEQRRVRTVIAFFPLFFHHFMTARVVSRHRFR